MSSVCFTSKFLLLPLSIIFLYFEDVCLFSGSEQKQGLVDVFAVMKTWKKRLTGCRYNFICFTDGNGKDLIFSFFPFRPSVF